MDLTLISNDVDKLKELSKDNADNETEFIKKYSDFIENVITKLKETNESNPEERKTKNNKKKERERATAIDKIHTDINLILTKSDSFCKKTSTEKIRSKRKTEQRIKKLCDEIHDVGTNTFNLDIDNVPEDESFRLKKESRRSWFSRSFDRISRSSSENDLNETEEEKKLKEEIENLEKELEKKKKKLSEMKDERRKREKEENENKKKNKKNEDEEENENKEEEKICITEHVTLLDKIDDLLVDGNCRQALELLNNTSILGSKLLGTTKSKAPRMFIILPDPKKCSNSKVLNYWMNFSNWNKSLFNLHLLCECSGGICENVDNETHLLETTPYSIRDPYKLISLFGPFLLYSINCFIESYGENWPMEVTKALGKTKPSDYFITITHEIQKVIKEERLVYKDERKNVDALESFIRISRNELEGFLKRYDYSNVFGGLNKKYTNDKKVRWVCDRHGKNLK
ncbi:hypothetical protein BCR32DRAFT_247483 [Anaeromyces robustus]|uniref:Uncharacterized protein n=1 Tax=Anaeromyces robustus TaxID=1754192 RepID=A0A1Y1WWS6_9FUNG|nr:hypothetical protein BCR32DRAFT_247483 [Anaeromyces robustus]|eukprot:ORX78011.1 hypothetical protein BCR32DRAFT_247483 [Anaeromyces robustus]